MYPFSICSYLNPVASYLLPYTVTNGIIIQPLQSDDAAWTTQTNLGLLQFGLHAHVDPMKLPFH